MGRVGGSLRSAKGLCFLAIDPTLTYARAMLALQSLSALPIKHAGKRIWRRYRAVPRRWRWPFSVVLGLFLIVILSNVLFQSNTRSELFEFRLTPGTEDSITKFVNPGQNATVSWSLIESRDGQPQIEATVDGPGLRRDDVHTGLNGSISFKGGFSRERYGFFMRNISHSASGVWRITWSLR